MSQRKIPESSLSEQHDKSDDKSKRKWVIKWNTVTHHGKIRIKMERWLWLDEEWGTASRLCVSHSESIAKLGWVVSEISIKSSEEWNLMWWLMMLHNKSWCSISFVPHYSFCLSLPYTFLSLASPLYLTSPFPITNIASFRTIEWVQKEVPTTAASNFLLDQVVIAYLEG